MASVVLATHCLAYQPEKNFWDQRRRAVRSARNTSSNSVLASVGSAGFLSAQFPDPKPLRPSLSPALERALPSSFLKQHQALLSALSPRYGSVRTVAMGAPLSAGQSRVVVCIQDVHHNAQAQAHIGAAVGNLIKSGRVSVIGLEGSSVPLDLQPFVDFPHREAVRLAADDLLRKNEITGPIHAALTSQGPLPRLVGVDDPVHYDANVRAVRDADAKRSDALRFLQTQHVEIERLKKQIYSSALATLDQTVVGYRTEKIGLGDYAQALFNLAQQPKTNNGHQKSRPSFPSTEKFLHALDLERSLPFAQIETEREQLIKTLIQTLTPEDVRFLSGESLAYRSGQRGFGEFYAGLDQLCRRNGINLARFPAMDAYVRYVLLVDGIAPERLLQELSDLESTAFSSLAETQEQRELINRSRENWLAQKLVDFTLTPSQWREWTSAHSRGDLDLSSFELFYKEALIRDRTMADTLAAGLAPGQAGVLVAGGFHADGIARRLTDQGVTVLSYVPKIESVDSAQGAAYLSVFSQEKTPLEKLFRGEKLFLSTNPLPDHTLKVALPAWVTLAALVMLIQVDPQLTYQVLGGVGHVSDVLVGSGLAQMAVAVGAGALIMTLKKNGSKVEGQVETPKIGGFKKFKILVWDPLREQVMYFFPAAILLPSLLTGLIVTSFGGGFLLAAATFLAVGVFGVFGGVTLFLGLEHSGYSQDQKVLMVVPALKMGALTLAGFAVAMAVLSPWGLGWIVYTDQFYSWIPAGEWKAFFLSALAGNLLGVWKHMVHNRNTLDNYLHWIGDATHVAPMPLSRTAAKKKPSPSPAFSKVRLTVPAGTSPTSLLSQWYARMTTLLSSRNVNEDDITQLVSDIKAINPKFHEANLALLSDVGRLHKNPSLVKQIVNAAVFLPLGAHSLGFDGKAPGGIPLNRQSWEGYSYLGEDIWLAEPAPGTMHISLRADFGFGIMPTVDYVSTGRSIVWASATKKPEEMSWSGRAAMDEWAKIMGQAAKVRNRGILLQLLYDNVFARRVSIKDDYNPTPHNHQIGNSIIRKDRGNPWDNYSPDAPIFVNARLKGLIDALIYLRDSVDPVNIEKNNQHLGIVFLKSELDNHLNSPGDNFGRRDALRQVTIGIIKQLGPVQERMANNDAPGALQAAISLLESIQGRLFLSYEDRYIAVNGKNPGFYDVEQTPIRTSPTFLSLIPEALQTKLRKSAPLVNDATGVSGAASWETASALPKSATSEVVNQPKSDATPFFPETDGSLHGLVSAILSIRWIQAGKSEPDNSAVEQTEKLKDQLWKKVAESNFIANDLFECREALNLTPAEIAFLTAYREIQKTGVLPSYNGIIDKTSLGEDAILQAHDSLVKKLGGNWNLLPVDFEEGEILEEEGIVSREFDVWSEFQLVIHKEHGQKLDTDNNAQKAIANVFSILAQRAHQAETHGERLVINKSRGELYSKGVHQFRSYGQDVFAKVVGRTIVILWVGPTDQSHGTNSFKANKPVTELIGNRADSFQQDSAQYVLVDKDFERFIGGQRRPSEKENPLTDSSASVEKPGGKSIFQELPEIRRIPSPQEAAGSHEEELARYEVVVGEDRFVVSHKKGSPQFYMQYGFSEFPFERISVEHMSRAGKEIEIPVGPYGILEFTPYREEGRIVSIEAEIRNGIPHPPGESPYNAGTVLMAVLLKNIAGPGVPISGSLSMTNATAFYHLVLKAREQKLPITFEQLRRVPAFRIPECEFAIEVSDMGVVEYTVQWTGQAGVPSRIANPDKFQLNSKNLDLFLYSFKGSNFLRDFGGSQSAQGLRGLEGPNSLLYIFSGRPGLGLGGALGEGMLLAWTALFFDPFLMVLAVLPVFSLLHAWVLVRKNPNLGWGKLAALFFWHWVLAVPYGLIGITAFQEMAGGERAAQVVAIGWHLLSDAYLMAKDLILARKAAQNTAADLLPRAVPLGVEGVGGAHWATQVRPRLARPGFARAYEKALAGLLSENFKEVVPRSPDLLVPWLESRLSGVPANGKEETVYVQVVGLEDVENVLRSAEIVRGWADRGLKRPRLVLAAKDADVLAKLQPAAKPGVVDVVEKPVTDDNGALAPTLLLDSLKQIQISPSARLSLIVSPSISVNADAVNQLEGDGLAQRLRDALMILLKGDPIRPLELRTLLEVASKVLESA